LHLTPTWSHLWWTENHHRVRRAGEIRDDHGVHFGGVPGTPPGMTKQTPSLAPVFSSDVNSVRVISQQKRKFLSLIKYQHFNTRKKTLIFHVHIDDQPISPLGFMHKRHYLGLPTSFKKKKHLHHRYSQDWHSNLIK
jgi:hypothetical protein